VATDGICTRLTDHPRITVALGAVPGVVIGAVLGWPYKSPIIHGGPVPLLTPYPTFHQTTYHNALVSGRLAYVSSVGVLAAYVCVLLGAGFCYAFLKIYKRSTRPRPGRDAMNVG
jgi:hypothetical protein